MARYFFHVETGQGVVHLDVEGVDLPNGTIAQQEAATAAREALLDEFLEGRPLSLNSTFRVVDSQGQLLCVYPFKKAVEGRANFD